MQQKLTQIIKQIAVDAIETKKPLDVVIGNIISVEPLKINLSQFVDIKEDMVVIPSEYKEHEEKIIIPEQKINLLDENEEEKEYTIKEQEITIKIQSKLKVGMSVYLLRFNKGQKFYMLNLLN
jgi:hypothetical protein